jgi:dTDP-4-amino-4,6-dideoxygalactose transaminase
VLNLSPIRLAKSILGPDEANAVSRVILEDGYLGMGREVESFEAEIAAFLGVPPSHVVCVSSGTAALHLAVAATCKADDEVLVQSLTYVASYQAISAAALPVSCEVLPANITINLEDAAKRITPATRAIMPVHYASNPGDLGAIYGFAKKHGIRVIEDAAHAFGCSYDGKLIGSFGDIICFSFDGIKNITSGEGGAVVTADADVAQQVRDARLLGVEKDTNKRFLGERSWEFNVSQQGYRYHMSNLFAAIGRVQLGRFAKEFAPKRVALARQYRTLLANVPQVSLLESDLGAIIPHIQPICVAKRRDDLKDYLEKNSIQTGIHYKPNHLLSYYGDGKESLVASEKLYKELLSLPLHPEMHSDDVHAICTLIIKFLTP